MWYCNILSPLGTSCPLFVPPGLLLLIIIIIIPLAIQPTVGFGLSNNVLPFFPICHPLSSFSHSQHLKISFYTLFPSFPGSSPSSRPFHFLSEDLFMCLQLQDSEILYSALIGYFCIFYGSCNQQRIFPSTSRERFL